GLLEHTLSMAAIAETLASHYPYVNKDLLLAGVLIHDIGKTFEYTVDEAFAFSDDGRLVGHIVRGIVMVEKAAAELDNFPQAELRDLIHLIASHHGTQEWGSPVVPKTLEAILLHQIDLLDSRIQGFLDYVKLDDGRGDWTIKNSPMFRTELRRPDGMKND
ncbi:MAG: HD domain-containing protein, partial [Chloroflexi bacterium]|nr:HD domain-containing protein [Chloroflexota bacterium]